MGRNFILKRILSMVAMALAMATILIAGIYAVVTPGKVAKAKVQELLPRAWAAADLVNEYMLGNISMDVPVSYTHLDVYKRQLQARPLGESGGGGPDARYCVILPAVYGFLVIPVLGFPEACYSIPPSPPG